MPRCRQHRSERYAPYTTTDSECPICLERLNLDAVLVSCRHAFHRKCVQDMLIVSSIVTFPTCRCPLTNMDLINLDVHRGGLFKMDIEFTSLQSALNHELQVRVDSLNGEQILDKAIRVCFKDGTKPTETSECAYCDPRRLQQTMVNCTQNQDGLPGVATNTVWNEPQKRCILRTCRQHYPSQKVMPTLMPLGHA